LPPTTTARRCGGVSGVGVELGVAAMWGSSRIVVDVVLPETPWIRDFRPLCRARNSQYLIPSVS